MLEKKGWSIEHLIRARSGSMQEGAGEEGYDPHCDPPSMVPVSSVFASWGQQEGEDEHARRVVWRRKWER